MIGLMLMIALLVFIGLCGLFVFGISRLAKKRGKNPFKYGIVTSLILAMIITWDSIPSNIYYHYQCKQLPPLKINKTPEEWIKENENEIKDINVNPDKINDKISKEILYRSFINSRLVWERKKESRETLNTYQLGNYLIDNKTGETLLDLQSIHQINMRLPKFLSMPDIFPTGRKCFFDSTDEIEFSNVKNKYLELIKEKQNAN